MISEPLLGWRAVRVTERRTAVDFAEVIRWLVEEVHEEAEKVVLVMDNLKSLCQMLWTGFDSGGVLDLDPIDELGSRDHRLKPGRSDQRSPTP